ncbi:MAG TPA: MFS transporter [Methylophilaceae bacterium]|jgi:FSR family fosmidomycin resistance protein-like MFS transporter
MTTQSQAISIQEISIQPGDIQETRPTKFGVIAAISFSHFLNDMMQSVLLAIYPILKLNLSLSFAQIGLISFCFQVTGSLLQPLIGLYTDHKPKPYTLPFGMLLTMSGLLVLGRSTSFEMVLIAAMLIGMGSSIFHPESSRVARLAAGDRPGLSQSLFQVGGNLGGSIGPLLAAMIILPHGMASVAWFAAAALIGAIVLSNVSYWYSQHLASALHKGIKVVSSGFSRTQIIGSLTVLGILMFSKFIYIASLTNYYTFFLIEKFHLSLHDAQLYLFAFLLSSAAGTFLGGPIGDKIGRKKVIWWSILGVAPFTMMLPYANLHWTLVLSIIIGLVLSSAFSAILVFAQELIPNRVGTISGLFFGLAFGIAGIAAALLGNLADVTSVQHVYRLCAFLPLLGIAAIFLPDIQKH